MRAADLCRYPAWDRAGQRLGRVVDVVVEAERAGPPRVVAVVVSTGWYGRLLGYVRTEAHGPWLLEQIAKLLSRDMRTVAWDDVRIGDSPDRHGR